MSSIYLLDTCAFLWLTAKLERRFERASREALRSDSVLLLSQASVWEMCIKGRLGKLPFKESVEYVVGRQVAEGLQIIPIGLDHIYRTERLPLHHRDPFDRLLIAQALELGLPLISSDTAFDAYGIARIW